MSLLFTRVNLTNLSGLMGVQIGNALIPLLIIPYSLVKVGSGPFAQIVVAEAVSIIALTVVLYSFEVDGVARTAMAARRGSRVRLALIVDEIVCTRLLLFCLSAPPLIAGFAIVSPQGLEFLLCWLTVPASQIFLSYWFYQGIQRNHVPALITLGTRIATLAGVLLFVKDQADALWVPLAIGGPALTGGIVSYFFIHRSLRTRTRWVGLARIRRNLLQGKEIFAGNLAVMLYREMNVVYLGIGGVSATGISTYSLVEKGVKMLQATTRPMSQVFFPQVVEQLDARNGPNMAAAILVLRYTLPQLAIAAAIIVLTPLAFILAASAIPQIGSLAVLPELGTMALVMLPAILFGLANFMFGTVGLNYLGARSSLLACISAVGLASSVACLILSKSFGSLGGAFAFLGSEVLLLALVLRIYHRARRRSGAAKT